MSSYGLRQKKYYEENKEKIKDKLRTKPKIFLPTSGLTFRFKKDLEEYIKAEIPKIIDKEITKTHYFYNTLLDVFHRYPKYENCNPSSFMLISSQNRSESPGLSKFLRRGEKYRPHFKTNIWRVFSLKDCLKKDEKTDKSKVIKALRAEIREQINTYRRENPKCICCQSENEVEIDHIVSFKRLSEAFMNICPDIEVGKNEIYYTVLDNNLRNKWLDYHKEKCLLQSLCKKCHRDKSIFDSKDTPSARLPSSPLVREAICRGYPPSAFLEETEPSICKQKMEDFLIL
jgi:hypothetical protein